MGWAKNAEILSVERILRFCTNAVMFAPDLVADLIEQLGRFGNGAFIRQIRGRHNSALNKVHALHATRQITHLIKCFSQHFFRVSTLRWGY